MEKSQQKRNENRIKRAMRVRKRLHGNTTRPRLHVFKSSKHIYAQLIDDEQAVTLASISTLSTKSGEQIQKNKESAKQLGVKIAGLAKEKNISNVIFDRGRYKYHGVIAALADGAREGGLQL